MIFTRKFMLDMLVGIAYTWRCESYACKRQFAIKPAAFLCPLYITTSDAKGRWGGSIQKRATVGDAKLLAGSLPISLLRFLFRSFDMPASKEVTTVVLDTPAPAPVRHYWELFATDGPADLYRGFAMDAVDAFLKPLGSIEEEQFNLIMEAVNIAVDVALRAAHVPDSWLSQYEAATAHLVSTGETTHG